LLLPLYDPLQTLMGGNAMRGAMLAEADIQPGQSVLDIGCGTGSLIVQLLRIQAQADVTGLDPDPKALERARKKADRAGVSPRLEQGFSDALPFPDTSFDFVFSSFMFHHLKPDAQQTTLEEARRVLKPGGSFHLVDFRGMAENDTLPSRMEETGFASAREVAMRRNLLGRVAHHVGSV
jgi:ubiquinone/menaquinone biosynthesis C-methylase UbiE